MVKINAHFDGKVIVPDEPVKLPRGKRLVIRIQLTENSDRQTAHEMQKLSKFSRNALKKWMLENPY